MITEADTCRKYVLPKLIDAGWSDEQISEQKTFTKGRIIVAGKGIFRKENQRGKAVQRSDSRNGKKNSLPSICGVETRDAV